VVSFGEEEIEAGADSVIDTRSAGSRDAPLVAQEARRGESDCSGGRLGEQSDPDPQRRAGAGARALDPVVDGLGCVLDLDDTVSVGIQSEAGIGAPIEGGAYRCLLGGGRPRAKPDHCCCHSEACDERGSVPPSFSLPSLPSLPSLHRNRNHSAENGRLNPTMAPPSAALRANTSPPWSVLTASTMERPSPDPGRDRAWGDR